MNNAETIVALPLRIARLATKDPSARGLSQTHGPLGAPGTLPGDVGWSTINLPAWHVEAFMAQNPRAAMPCWRRPGIVERLVKAAEQEASKRAARGF